MGRAVTKDIPAFKRSYNQRPCIKTAMVTAGYSPKVASQGLAQAPKQIRTFVLAKQRKLNKLAQLAETCDAQTQEQIARGALLSNVAEGKDRAHASIKLLGQDKRVNMFTPDSVAGVVIIQAVPLPDLSDCPTIDAIDAQVTDNE
jgi:hypothetical protein